MTFILRAIKIDILRIYLLTIAAFVAMPGMLAAQSETKTGLRMTPAEIQNARSVLKDVPGSSNLSAVQVVVIAGDPSKPGLYTILLKVAAHTQIPAHLHPDERMGTIVAGTWFFGYGDVFDKSKLKTLPMGSIYSEVAGQNHFAMTQDEPVIAQITGYGPSGVTYVNPKDNPKQ